MGDRGGMAIVVPTHVANPELSNGGATTSHPLSHTERDESSDKAGGSMGKYELRATTGENEYYSAHHSDGCAGDEGSTIPQERSTNG